MKLRRIKFSGHSVLGDLELDFCVDNVPVSTVLIAGENCTGKTSILNAIYNLSNLKLDILPIGEGCEYEIALSIEERSAIAKIPSYIMHGGQPIGDVIIVKISEKDLDSWSRFTVTSIEGENIEYMPAWMLAKEDMHPLFRFSYSNTGVNFTPSKLSSITAKNIDENTASQTTNPDTATEITQLLIDIQASDDADTARWVRENRGQPIDHSLIDQRISRFREAFSSIFPSKQYSEVRNENAERKVVFLDNGKECFIEELSSGEKQIVFRGGFFLKDSGASIQPISLVDEPEISLHPGWQLKIMDFYKSILGINSEKNQSQLIVATHSPFILHNRNRTDDKIIVLTRGECGDIQVSDEPSFYGWTHATAIKEAFSISADDESNTTLILVEGKTDEKYINAAIAKLGNDSLANEIDVKWVGRIGDNGGPEFTGDSALNQTLAFVKSNPTAMKRPLVLLYDCDTNKPDETFGNKAVRKVPLMSESRMRKGIENLLIIPDELDLTPFIDEKETTDGYGISNTKKTLNKNRLCDYIIEQVEAGVYGNIFDNFATLLSELTDTVGEIKSHR